MRMTFREALREVLRREMARNGDLIVIGETIATRGGAKGVTLGLADQFGPERVRETPISENVIVGAALGGALAGLTMVAEVYSADFLFTAGSEVINDMAKWRYQHRWPLPINLVLRMPMGAAGAASGPEHSQCIEAFLQHVPGLTVVVPGSVRDAARGLRAAIHAGDPVIFLEHRKLYDLEEEVDEVVFEEPTSRLAGGAVVREGSDCTVVAWGWMRHIALEAAQAVAGRGIGAEVVDPFVLSPLDVDVVRRSVEKTGRLVVVEESPKTGSVAAEIICAVQERLGRPVQAGRVTMPDIPHPYLPALEATCVPDSDSVAREILAQCSLS